MTAVAPLLSSRNALCSLNDALSLTALPASGRNVLMDWLRAFGAIWVVLFHINEPLPFVPSPWRWFCEYGWLGVPVFFAVSGYCMATLANKNPSPQSFLASRWVRILIPYWASLVVVLGVVGFRLLAAGVNDVTRLPWGMTSLLATLTLSTSPVTDVPTMNWVYWSLSYELAFYLLVALALLSRKVSTFIAVCFVGSVVVSSLYPSFLNTPPCFWCNKFSLFLVGWYGFQCAPKRCVWSHIVSFAAVVIAAAWLTTSLEVVAALTATLLVIVGEQVTRLPVLSSAPAKRLQILGEQSYSLYLLHVPIGVHLLCRLRPSNGSELTHIVFDLLVLAACLLASGLFYRLVEVPAHRLAQVIGRRSASTNVPVQV